MEATSHSSLFVQKHDKNDSDISLSISLSSWNFNLPNISGKSLLFNGSDRTSRIGGAAMQVQPWNSGEIMRCSLAWYNEIKH